MKSARFLPFPTSEEYTEQAAAIERRIAAWREKGAAMRATLAVGNFLELNHFGSNRLMKVEKVTKSRVTFRWESRTSGKARLVSFNDIQLGERLSRAEEVR